MALQFSTSYIEDSLALFRQYKRLAEFAMEQVTDEQLQAALDPETNSIAKIVKHLSGNMRSRWTDFLTSDGENCGACALACTSGATCLAGTCTCTQGTDPASCAGQCTDLASDPDQFPQDVLELMGYLGPAAPEQRVMAIPGTGLKVPIWILGSSLFGAQVAAALGLPFSFASHFAPAMMMQAIDIYRARFQPSEQLDRPYVMLGFNVIAADSDAQAHLLATSVQQAFVNLRSGRPIQLPPPLEGYESHLPPPARALLADVLTCAAIGSPQTVRNALAAFIERTKADELMITAQIFDHSARLRSYEIAADIQKTLN